MTLAEGVPIAGVRATCPMCHTVDESITIETLGTGGTWKCTRCGQTWSAQRLEAVAAYARFEAARRGRL